MNRLYQERWQSAIDTQKKPLMREKIVLGSMVLSLLFLASYGFADEGRTHASRTHMKVSGVVSKVQSTHVIIKTSWGQMTIASVATPKGLEVGEEVEMQVNENNTVIDVHRKGDSAHAHRYITGNLLYVGKMKKEIKLWTPEGEKYSRLTGSRSKQGGLKKGPWSRWNSMKPGPWLICIVSPWR